LVSRRDQGTALLVFLVLGLIEETAVSHTGLLNERIVAVCAAGLVAGPGVGLAVGVFVTWLAVVHHGLPLGSIAIPMLCGGLAGGSLYRSYPKLAQRPPTGFCLTFGVSLVRTGLIFWLAPHSPAALQRIEEIGMAPLLQGLGTALIWLLSSRYIGADRDVCTIRQRLVDRGSPSFGGQPPRRNLGAKLSSHEKARLWVFRILVTVIVLELIHLGIHYFGLPTI
jgi:hypothetical protein